VNLQARYHPRIPRTPSTSNRMTTTALVLCLCALLTTRQTTQQAWPSPLKLFGRCSNFAHYCPCLFWTKMIMICLSCIKKLYHSPCSVPCTFLYPSTLPPPSWFLPSRIGNDRELFNAYYFAPAAVYSSIPSCLPEFSLDTMTLYDSEYYCCKISCSSRSFARFITDP
jgi:hypothetical protein